MLAGYRTFLFGLAVIALGLLGKHVDQAVIYDWCDVILGAVGVGIIVFRLFTKTPFGAKAVAAVAAQIGYTTSDLDALGASIDAATDTTVDLKGQVANLSSAVEKVTGHPLFQPDTAAVLATLADSLPKLISALPAPASGAAPAADQPVLQQSAPSPETASAGAVA